jgi:hypothetical protein
VKRIYRYSLDGTIAVLNDQLEMAKAKQYVVQVRSHDVFLSLLENYWPLLINT